MSDAPTPSGTATPAAPPPAKVATPPKPAAPKAPVKGGKSRRFFLLGMVGTWFAAGWTAFTATVVITTLGTLRFLFPNVLSEPPATFKAGYPSNIEDRPQGTVVEFKDKNAWVVRYQGQIFALSTTCTHLGCTPNWLESAQKFKCPCHGSGFKITGVNFEGPAPRPLERWGISISEDGQILVDKSKKFQKELGQWNNPESFIKVV
jgi:cytochrome b6-f complex iron-sulfur subunit